MSIPPVSTDLKTLQADLEISGIAVLGGALDQAEVSAARTRLLDQAGAEREAGTAFLERGDVSSGKYETDRDLPNQRVWGLINKGEIFRRIAEKTVPLQLVSSAFASSYAYPKQTIDEFGFGDVLLSSLGANIACLGGLPMNLHTDQGFSPFATSYPIIINVMYMLTEFTAENGATRVAPGSHLEPDPGRYFDIPPETFPVTGSAGTAVIFDGRLWHGTGQNRTKQPRCALFATYCRPFIRQIENYALSLDPDVRDECSETLMALLGFRTWSVLGSVEGSKHGDFVHNRSRGTPLSKESQGDT